MSAANGATEKKDTYLQHVSLKNYKSVKDAEIDFKPGLNIIIGKNASGKTNFVNGLDNILNFEDSKLLDTEFEIKCFFKEKTIAIKALMDTQEVDLLSRNGVHRALMNHQIMLTIDDVKSQICSYDDIKSDLLDNDSFINETTIKYGIHYKEGASFINVPFSFIMMNNGKVSRDLMSVSNEENTTEFLQSFFYRLYVNLVRVNNIRKESISTEGLKDNIIRFSDYGLKKINAVIFELTSIAKIRLNPDFNVIAEDSGQKQSIGNFYLEFLVDKSWLTFNFLSDGTKRLFYIISELLGKDALIEEENSDLNIILLEEPELGIHPHQLHKLMQFIKEQSREKQIIITTHSPQVLDILGPDDLDRIIICHSDPKNGTKLSHLTEKEIAKAKKYMEEEAYLSDYWRFSDLEPAS